MKINKVLVKISNGLLFYFVSIFCVLNLYSGAPPGVYVPTTTVSSSKKDGGKTKLSLSYGSYRPSLNIINDDLNYYGIKSIGSKSVYTLGIEKTSVIANFSYWTGNTTAQNFKETVSLYIIGVGGKVWNIAKLFPKPYSEYFDLNWNLMVRDIFATLKDEYINNNIYVLFTALTIDFVTGVELEIFPFVEHKFFSFSLGWDYVFFSLPVFPFEVFDTSENSPYKIGDTYKSHNGKDITAETDGTVLRFSINLRF